MNNMNFDEDSSYKDASLYYQQYIDFLYTKSKLDDFNFWKNIAKENYPKVLELGCGYGRLLSLFPQENSLVKGLEFSSSMIEYGAKKYPNLDIVRGDMRDFDLGEKFDLIFLAFNTFFHLYTYDDLKNCLDCIKKHLTVDGKLIIAITHISEALLKDLILLPQKENVSGVFRHPESEEVIVKTLLRSYDAPHQILTLNIKYIYTESKQESTEKLPAKLYFPKELEFLLRSHQFQIDQVFGDYEFNDFNKDSPEQIVICSL